MVVKKLVAIFFFTLVIAISLSLFTESQVCKKKTETSEEILSWFPRDAQVFYANYVLAPEEGFFRRPCHKYRMLSILNKSPRKFNELELNIQILFPYIGMYMENKYLDNAYHEAIRYYSIDIFNKNHSEKDAKEIHRFYINDKESKRYLEKLTPKSKY